eukprot:TRINITY_DN2970_c0_g1_i4.p4 TRINITY_DN2970_c0_g1~~TRINITY_DN2970_c0_g1_i4.p4  ORF type:complete len:185 (+),score=-23.82 TRINITY_DN2970_c0_g1_i4:743-1297(+)
MLCIILLKFIGLHVFVFLKFMARFSFVWISDICYKCTICVYIYTYNYILEIYVVQKKQGISMGIVLLSTNFFKNAIIYQYIQQQYLLNIFLLCLVPINVCNCTSVWAQYCFLQIYLKMQQQYINIFNNNTYQIYFYFVQYQQMFVIVRQYGHSTAFYKFIQKCNNNILIYSQKIQYTQLANTTQ